MPRPQVYERGSTESKGLGRGGGNRWRMAGQPGYRRRPSTDYFPAGIFNAKSVSRMSGIPAIVKKKKKPNPASIKVFIV